MAVESPAQAFDDLPIGHAGVQLAQPARGRHPRRRRAGSVGEGRSPIRDRASLPDVLLIDAANVVGSRPTGWWRDRAQAAEQFIARVRAATASSTLSPPVVVVLEGVARRGVEEGVTDGVEVVHASDHGDDALVALAESASEPVILVSADRALARRCRAVDSDVTCVGPSWLLDQLRP